MKPITHGGSDLLEADAAHPNKVELHLAGSIGIPEDHPSTPRSIHLTLNKPRDRSSVVFGFSHSFPQSPTFSTMSSAAGSMPRSNSPSAGSDAEQATHWPFKEALHSRRLVLVEDCSVVVEGYPVRVWDELPNSAVIVPISSDSDEGIPSAVLVVGLSVRRPFDDDYEAFIHVLRSQLASGIAAVRAYEAEMRRVEDLAALDRAKSLLFSNVSHELRTPLTLVAGPIDDLLAETADGPKKEILVMARRNIRRLTRLVSTLMDVSRLEAGRLKGSFRRVNLGIMTRDLAALFRGAIERAKLTFIVKCDASTKDVYIDPEHWEKIVFNLIGNALKYTMAGSIHVSLVYEGKEAVFSVRDTGVGIPRADINLVGERFHRVQSVSRSHEGTGIGLALIKELIKLHGGLLTIESSTAAESGDGNHGSVFRVTVPLGSDHLPPDAIERHDAHLSHAETTYGQGIVDEAMLWARDRDKDGSSADSNSDSGGTSGESSSKSGRGLDTNTLYFKKEDTILLVDGQSVGL